MIGQFLILGFGLTGQCLLGTALVMLLLPSVRGARNKLGPGAPVAELLGLSIVLGIALTSYLQFLWSSWGGLLGLPVSLSLSGFGWIAGGIGLYRRWRRTSCLAAPTAVPAQQSRQGAAIERCCIGLIGLLFVTAVVQALLTPQRLWDERAIFGLKALVLYQDQTVHSTALAHKDFVQYHPRYPLLIPLAEQNVYALLGEANDRLSKVLFPLLYLGLVLTFAGVLARHVGRSWAWLGAAMLATAPALMPWEYGFLSGQADAPVACFHGVSVLFLWDWLRSSSGQNQTARSSQILVAAICAAMTIFTKDEGLALYAVDLCALSAILSLDRRWSFKEALCVCGLFAAVTLLITAPWLWHRVQLPTTTEMTYAHRLSTTTLVAGCATLGWSLRHLGIRMLAEAATWGLQWWGVLISLIAAPRRARSSHQLLLLIDLGGALAALILAGMIAPTPVEEHLGGSAHRFLIQITPTAVLFFVGQCAVGSARRRTIP